MVRKVGLRVGGSHIFGAILVHGKMDGTKRSPTNLLLYDVLIDAMDSGAIVITATVMRAGIEGFLKRQISSSSRGRRA